MGRPATRQGRVAAVQAAVDRLTAVELGEEYAARHRWYSGEEWRARGEHVGADARLVLLIEESPWFMILNHYSLDLELEERLHLLVESQGFSCGLGYTWSLHFYPVPGWVWVPGPRCIHSGERRRPR